MDSNVIVTILLVLAGVTAVNLLLLCFISWRIRAFRRGFYDFINPADGQEKSALDILIDRVSTSIGHAAFNQVRSMGAATQSAQVRGERAVDAAVSQDILTQANPVIGALLESMPQLKKILGRNPGLADYAIQQLITRAGAQGPTVERPSDNHETGTTITIT